MEKLIDCIIKKEWKQFQNVNNMGGRADCQDNWNEFYVMRKAQFIHWPQELLESYQNDLEEAERKGENLIYRKYAFMMHDTDPEGYRRLEHTLPKISEERMRRTAQTVMIALQWALEFENQFPLFGKNGRPVYKEQAGPGITSVETYLTGELCSYGEQTEKLYAAHIRQNRKEGNNLTYHERLFIAKMYGYHSVEEVEHFLEQKQRKSI